MGDMEEKKLQELLTELNDELEQIDRVDPATLKLVKDLDEDINRLLEGNETDVEGVVDRAQSIQTRFALEHPVAERFLREIIDALSRVGI
ncbi:MAG: DUF4404 family protein [Xanthomonadales bacterium]|jgi:hypothetical protein|nr:DUF4404 family protein [Xanthomonadales bacterium]